MSVMRSASAPMLMTAALFFLPGCSDDLGDRQSITGAVTLKGKPLDQGSIEFIPLEPAAHGAIETKSGAPIVQGEYEIPREQGLMPGKYRVSITSGTEPPPLKEGELPGPTAFISKERIPAKYNVKSQLEATVTESGPNEFDFDIP